MLQRKWKGSDEVRRQEDGQAYGGQGSAFAYFGMCVPCNLPATRPLARVRGQDMGPGALTPDYVP